MRTARVGGLCARIWDGGRVTVACFPPAGGGALTFRPLAAVLAPTMTVIALDPPGHGASDGPPLTDVPAMARLAADVLARRQPGPVALVGHSLGGCVAYETARLLARARGPGGLRLALCATASPTTPATLPVATDDATFLDTMAGLGGIPHALMAVPELLGQYLPLLRGDLAAYDAYVRGWIAPRSPLMVPTLVVGGDADPVVPWHRLTAWQDLCSPTVFRLFPGGHHIPQQRPAELAVELRRWLATAEPAGDLSAGWAS